jgi:tetratricopeptide (TPR) repeat protein
MKGLTRFRLARIPYIPRRVVGRLPLIAIGVAIAAIALYGIRPRISNAVSNVRGYSLLEEGQFDQAIEQFQGVVNQSPTEPNPWDSLGEGYLAIGMPDRALDAYSRALAVDSAYSPSILGRGLALAALGRYDEALEKQSPDFRVQAFLLSRVGRYREATDVLDKGISEDDDAEVDASALLTSAWMSIELKQHTRALENVRAAETALANRTNHSLLMLADLIGGVAEIRAGNVKNATVRAAAQKARYVSDVPVESNWIAALEREIALAQGRYDDAAASFKAAENRVWQILGRDASTVFATSLPTRDALARVEIARGNRTAAIDEYRRLTASSGSRSSAVLEPRYVLELARLLDAAGDAAGARVEYERFLAWWGHADSDLPELAEAKLALSSK